MSIEITIPRLGWSMEEGTFLGWLKQDGDAVQSGDLLFTLESEKTAQEVESLDAGILRIPSDAPQAGDIVKVGQRLGFLVEKGEALPDATSPGPVAPPPVAAETPPVTMQTASAPPARTQTPASPRARRIAAELKVNLATLQATGNGGRIRERDVRGAAPNGAAKPAPTGREMPITSLRRTIAGRMVHSLRNTAPVTLTCRADATQLVGLRNQFKAAGGGAIVPSFTDIIAKLTAVALQRHPLLAARWEDDCIVLPDALHIGIAVDTEHGLLVPVLRDVQALSLPEIAARSRELIAATRARKAKAEDLQGGGFTSSNLGGFGIEAFTPIINFPETAILGLGAIRREVVALEDGTLTSREQLALSLTFDHRIVDGAPAARFLQTLTSGIGNPVVSLLAAPPTPVFQS